VCECLFPSVCACVCVNVCVWKFLCEEIYHQARELNHMYEGVFTWLFVGYNGSKNMFLISVCLSAYVFCMCVFVCQCVCVCVCTCVCVCVCVRVCVRVCVTPHFIIMCGLAARHCIILVSTSNAAIPMPSSNPLPSISHMPANAASRIGLE